MSFVLSFAISLLVAFVLASILFIEAVRQKDAYLSRLGWGVYPVIVAMINIFVLSAQTPRLLLMFVLIFVLGAQHVILSRHREIQRPDQDRQGIAVYLKSYLLKALYGTVFVVPVILVAQIQYNPPLGMMDAFGALVWLFGFIYRYTHVDAADRRGEIIQWWGIWVISLSSAYGIFGIFAPVLATIVLYFFYGKKNLVQG